MDATTNSTITASINTTTTTNSNNNSIAATCKAKSYERKTSRIILTNRLWKGHTSNVIAMANCIMLKLPGLHEKYVQLTKSQYINARAATRTTAITINATTSNTNTTTVTTITFTPNCMKVKFPRNFEGEVNWIRTHHLYAGLSKERDSYILGIVWCVKLKIIGLVVGDVELTKRKCFHLKCYWFYS